MRHVWIGFLLATAIGACAAPRGENPFAAGARGKITETRTAPPAPCPEPDPHPVAAAIADDFEADYDEVIGWFCRGHSFEDILLALQTERLAPIDPDDVLAERARGKTWDVIWNELGITAPGPTRSGP